jgi:hypothetical protein
MGMASSAPLVDLRNLVLQEAVMRRILAVLFLLSPISADAQAIHDQRHPMPDDPRGIRSERPTQPGQAAFAAI